jgi:hypothetical protein
VSLGLATTPYDVNQLETEVDLWRQMSYTIIALPGILLMERIALHVK